MLLRCGFSPFRVWPLQHRFFLLESRLCGSVDGISSTRRHMRPRVRSRDFSSRRPNYVARTFPARRKCLRVSQMGSPHSGTMSHTYQSVHEKIQPDYSQDYKKLPTLLRVSHSKTNQQSNTGKINTIAFISKHAQ